MQIPHQKIGVVDTQWIVHQSVPSLGNQVNEALKCFSQYLLHGLSGDLFFVSSIGASRGWKGTMGRGMYEFLPPTIELRFHVLLQFFFNNLRSIHVIETFWHSW